MVPIWSPMLKIGPLSGEMLLFKAVVILNISGGSISKNDASNMLISDF